MKRLHKRILTVCLALMMSVVMAVPAFADSATEYYVTTWDDTNIYLNVDRSSTSIPAKGRRLITYRTFAPGTDQKFRIESCSSEEYYGVALVFAATPTLALNRDSSNARAILWTLSDGANDSILNSQQIDNWGNGGSSGFMLVRTSEFACYPKTDTGQDVVFKHYLNNFDGWIDNWRVYDTNRKG